MPIQRLLPLAVACLVCGSSLHAQRWGVAAGIVAPTSSLASRRSAGPYFNSSMLLGAPARRLGVRVDVDAAWLAGRTVKTPGGAVSYGDMRVVGALGYLVVAPREPRRVRPYALVGGGVDWMHVTGLAEHNNTAGALGIGGGVAMPAGRRVRITLEARVHGALSDYGNRDFASTAYWPITMGVRF
jgi:hypothetical protein